METLGVRITMAEEALIYVQTLYGIICDSEEPETIRKALAALTATTGGIEFLQMHPIAL
jgi:hypothetical protein